MRAVLDPNVLVSAAISERGAPRELLDRWEVGEFELIVSAEILFELQDVLARPKFRRYLTETEAINHVLRIYDGAAEVSEELPKEVVGGVTGDPDDDYIVGVAFLAKADVLVSGDRHLLGLPQRRISDSERSTIIRVLTPREFLEELRQTG